MTVDRASCQSEFARNVIEAAPGDERFIDDLTFLVAANAAGIHGSSRLRRIAGSPLAPQIRDTSGQRLLTTAPDDSIITVLLRSSVLAPRDDTPISVIDWRRIR